MDLNPTNYPLIPWYSEAEQALLMSTEEGMAALAEAYVAREELIANAQEDPFNHEPPLPHWADADALLEGHIPTTTALDTITASTQADPDCQPSPTLTQSTSVASPSPNPLLFLILLGGNRSGKSRYAGWRTIKSAVANPRSNILCLAENEKTSIQTQQAIIWHYLPKEWKALNGKRSPKFYIKYSDHHGFSDGMCQLPNGTKLHFKTYNQDPNDCEGWMFGRAGNVTVGCWADENLRVNWLGMLLRRLRFQQAQLLWSYTPIHGMTPTIAEAVGDSPKILLSAPAELLPGKVNVPGTEVGTMPYIADAALNRGRTIYFWSSLNPFGDGQRSFYEGVREDCAGRSSEYIQRIAYGYTRKTSGKPFPLWGSWNIIPHGELPKDGTDYLIVDPAGGRNWFMFWVRVTRDGRHYIYREWPDEQTYGEWAIPNPESTGDNLAKLHKAGPAQNSLGYGVSRYKQLWRDTEAAGGDDVWCRYIDPRAGRNPQAARHGGTCLVDEFAVDEQIGGRIEPGVEVIPASGVGVGEGLTQINELLHWNPDAPLDMLMNSPQLFVSDRCRQIIGMFQHWPGEPGGEKHPWKDPADCVRYMALAKLQPIGTDMEVCYE